MIFPCAVSHDLAAYERYIDADNAREAFIDCRAAEMVVDDAFGLLVESGMAGERAVQMMARAQASGNSAEMVFAGGMVMSVIRQMAETKAAQEADGVAA